MSSLLCSLWLKMCLCFFILAPPQQAYILKHHTSSATSEVCAFRLLSPSEIEPLEFGVEIDQWSRPGLKAHHVFLFMRVQGNLKIDSTAKHKKINKDFGAPALWKCCHYSLKLHLVPCSWALIRTIVLESVPGSSINGSYPKHYEPNLATVSAIK